MVSMFKRLIDKQWGTAGQLGTFVLVLAGLMLTGCVERTISITSQPTGALVYLNDTEVGRTPLQVPYDFYGVYDVRLQKVGYKPLWTKKKAIAPWWEAPGPDLLAELTSAKVKQQWHFQLQVTEPPDYDALLQRANETAKMMDPEE